MIQLDIVTPTKKLLSKACTAVNIPGYKGELGVMPEHTNLVTTIEVGLVRYENEAGRGKVAVRGGFAQIQNNKIMLLVDEGIEEAQINAEHLKNQSQELDRKLIAAEIGPDEREILFKERIWLNACLELV